MNILMVALGGALGAVCRYGFKLDFMSCWSCTWADKCKEDIIGVITKIDVVQ